MLTSEAAIKAIIESVINKCQQPSHEPEQITTGPSENLSQPSSSNHNLTNFMNLQDTRRAEGDIGDNPTSVIKKCQPSQESEQITTGPSENLSQLSSSNHNLTKRMNLHSTGYVEGDLDENPTSDLYNSSLWANDGETEATRGKTTSQNGEKNKNTANLGEGDKGQICKEEENSNASSEL